jgi:hypothetical protein
VLITQCNCRRNGSPGAGRPSSSTTTTGFANPLIRFLLDNVGVATTNMSIDAMSVRWLSRKLRQGGEGTLGRHGSYLPTVASMGIRDRPTSFRSPWQNGYAERLIGSVRRECTDHLIAFNAENLRRILAKYAIYYNEVRMHVSLGKGAPQSSGSETLLRIRSLAAYIIGTLDFRFRKRHFHGEWNYTISPKAKTLQQVRGRRLRSLKLL